MRHEIHVNFPSFPLPTNFPCNFSSFSQVISMTHIWQLLSGEKKKFNQSSLWFVRSRNRRQKIYIIHAYYIYIFVIKAQNKCTISESNYLLMCLNQSRQYFCLQCEMDITSKHVLFLFLLLSFVCLLLCLEMFVGGGLVCCFFVCVCHPLHFYFYF